MPKISQKGLQMPESPIRKLVPYSEIAKKKGNKVYHLNIGQPDIKTPQVALDAVKNTDIEVLEYSHSAGFESYRNKLSQYYINQNLPINTEDIIITTGGSEALLFALGSTMDAGDEIIIPEPFYANYNGFSVASGVKVVPVISTIETGFALPPIEDFEKLITSKTKAILICNPGNPTGYLYSKEEINQLAEIVKKHDLFLIADEVYREFIHDDVTEFYSVLQSERLKDHAIMIDSVSKRYSLCGARIGCIVSKNKALIATALKFAHVRLSPATYSLLASEAAINSDASYLLAVKKEYTARKNILMTALEQIDGVKVSDPRGAFYCIVELPVDDAEVFSKWLLTDFSDENETVMFAPAAGFYSTPGYGKKQIRIGFVLNKKDLLRSASILEKALQAYSN